MAAYCGKCGGQVMLNEEGWACIDCGKQFVRDNSMKVQK